MNFHIVTPFNRVDNFSILYEMLKPLGIVWHILVSEDLKFSFPSEAWIRIHTLTLPKHVDPCYYKLQWFVSNYSPVKADWYLMFLCDDDGLDSDFFDYIRAAKKTDVCYLVDGDNGDAIPKDCRFRHSAHRYIADPHNMFLGGIGSCKPIIRGEYLRSLAYANWCGGDQIAVLGLLEQFPNGVTYVNTTAVKFNFLQAGRWTTRKTAQQKTSTVSTAKDPSLSQEAGYQLPRLSSRRDAFFELLAHFNLKNIPLIVGFETCKELVSTGNLIKDSETLHFAISTSAETDGIFTELGYTKANSGYRKDKITISISAPPLKTKKINTVFGQVTVPFPVKGYLHNIFGPNWESYD